MRLCVSGCEWTSEFSVDTIGSDGSVKSIGKHGKNYEVRNLSGNSLLSYMMQYCRDCTKVEIFKICILSNLEGYISPCWPLSYQFMLL